MLNTLVAPISVRPRKKFFNAEQKKRFIEQWHVSGDSPQAFCKDHGIAYTTFYRWRQKPGLKKPKQAKHSDWSAVVLKNPPKEPIETMGVELTVPNGMMIRFSISFANLKTLLRELGYAAETVR